MNNTRALSTTLQMALGLLMVVGGIMHFTVDSARWHLPLIDALKSTGYLWEWIAAINLLGGVALLVNRFVPLALIVLTPISLNILLIHISNPGAGGIPIGLVVGGLQIALIVLYRLEFSHLLTLNASLEPRKTATPRASAKSSLEA